jgi:hypothetical protein
VVAETQGISVILASDTTPTTLRATAAAAAATAVAAPAAWLAEAGIGAAPPSGPRAICMNDTPQSPG